MMGLSNTVFRLLLGGSVCALALAQPRGRFLSGPDETDNHYPGLVASFGNQLLGSTTVNIMLPPPLADPTMCIFPEDFFADFNMTESSSQLQHDVALLAMAPVKRSCSTETKARVLNQFREQVSERVKVLILLETDYRYIHQYATLEPDSTGSRVSELDNVAILYLPYDFNREFSHAINETQLTSMASPFLFDESNERWEFLHTIDGSWDPRVLPPEFQEPEEYDWIRRVLFSLLIVSPCFRAAYLFYAGGGRLWLRRNDRGRIIGFLYVPPMPHWLSHGRPQVHEPVNETLTEAQFKVLPEVTFVPCEQSDVEGKSLVRLDPEQGDGSTATDQHSETPALVEETFMKSEDSPLSASSASEECSSCSKQQTAVISPSPQTLPMSARSTECSICLDDFAVGEKLVVLPRCGHSFHRDCMRPWLLERQGCCPLCKKGVLGSNESEKDSGDNSTDFSATPSR